ncbi:ACT domain-containing protein [Tepidiforma flava]|uniref:ACT domain-containing protein n=1 Tax=Tepidiforma flava TaxID=3004094 RepID=A0ABY7M9B1_9CHLR|nr:ACT domain-containing protein [Tepidiforma flava]WBL36266.1 ACT domain-containing protein [Tepidiforma flava]
MAVVRSIRITMPDRPGALSAVTTALAAHRVDIVRLDVVSHEGEYVVDDLLLEAATAEDIGAAIGGSGRR